jgi:hypothetical protein
MQYRAFLHPKNGRIREKVRESGRNFFSASQGGKLCDGKQPFTFAVPYRFLLSEGLVFASESAAEPKTAPPEPRGSLLSVSG